MISFSTFYKSFLLEMARPRKDNLLSGPEATQRFTILYNKVGNSLKYGTDFNGKDLIDVDGNPAYGLDDSVLQDRKLKYFFFVLTNPNFISNLDPNDPNYTNNLSNAINDSTKLMWSILSRNNETAPDQKRRFFKAIDLSIQNNLQYFNSPEFINHLSNPSLLATFINIVRIREQIVSTQAAGRREREHGMGVVDIDAIKSTTRDLNSQLNRRGAYDRRKIIR